MRTLWDRPDDQDIEERGDLYRDQYNEAGDE